MADQQQPGDRRALDAATQGGEDPDRREAERVQAGEASTRGRAGATLGLPDDTDAAPSWRDGSHNEVQR